MIADLRLEKVAINPDTFSRLLSGQKGSHNRPMGIESCSNVSSGYADFRGRSARFSRAVE